MMLNLGLSNAWPTSIGLYEIAIEEEFIQDALQQQVNDKLTVKMMELFDQYLQETINKKLDDYDDYRTSSWVNKYTSTSMEYHTHKGSQLSAVVYLVSNGDGAIVFHDPRSFASRGYDNNFNKLFEPIIFEPKEGSVVIFPSFLYHTARPAGYKISIPYDLFLLRDI